MCKAIVLNTKTSTTGRADRKEREMDKPDKTTNDLTG